MNHAKTDPACRHYKETGPFRRYLNERGRGKNCPICVPPRGVAATLIGMAEQNEAISHSGIDDHDELLRADVEARSYRTAAALIRKAAK